MASIRQINANRRNAQRSTGPKTAAGKSRSSLNHLVHGLRARTVVLPDESREEFDRIYDALDDLYQPQNASEQDLLDQMAIAKWKLVRAETLEADCFGEVMPLAARIALFDRLTQVQGRLERSYLTAYKELERIKTAREKLAPQAADDTATSEDAPPAKPRIPELSWIDENGIIWMSTRADRAAAAAEKAVLATGNDEQTRLAARRAAEETRATVLAEVNAEYQAELAAGRYSDADKP